MLWEGVLSAHPLPVEPSSSHLSQVTCAFADRAIFVCLKQAD